MELRKAKMDDVADIVEICGSAREFQREQGFMQWADGYPSATVIEADITASRGYMIYDGEAVIGYCVIDTVGDDEYDSKPEIWKSDGKYAAVHRLAFAKSARSKGLGKHVFEMIEEYVAKSGINIFKVDTGVENVRMQHILDRIGYRNCGIHTFRWGVRIAYEKIKVE